MTPSLGIVEQDTDMSQPPGNAAPEAEPAPIAPHRRMGRSRRAITSRFKGFDDNFDSFALGNDMKAESVQPEQPQLQESELFVPEILKEKVDNPPQPTLTQARSSRKRSPPPVVEEETNEDIMEQLAPAASNLKRRRLAEEATCGQGGDTLIPPAPPVVTSRTRTKKAKPEMDVLEVARQTREKEEAIARAQREELEAAMDGMDIEKIRNLAVVEVMEIKRTAPNPNAYIHGDEGDRWDDRWNGRKNFKNFQRRGQGPHRPLNKVIVPLEEVKKKDFGIGDEYWLESNKDEQRRKERGRPRRDRLISQTQSAPVFPQTQTDKSPDVEEIAPIDSSALSQRATRSRGQSDQARTSQFPQSPNKRAAEPLARHEPAKRVRQAVRNEDSDDSDDGLGFRFRKR